jgi:hypothetical protein
VVASVDQRVDPEKKYNLSLAVKNLLVPKIGVPKLVVDQLIPSSE